ncbi:hypothetical protein BJV82DRAFT_573748 [Fennellomyces sp. T-0311]|nr:hypothetical protein BJV82DRAFT_573748 [Fennellomyces sp. T-0311]
MEMCCARASDEVTDLWGYHPQDLVHRSLYELISAHDTDRLGRLHRLLLDNVMDIARQHDRTIGPDVRPPPAERTSSPLFYETDPENLVATAKGSSTFSDTLHIKKKEEDHELYEMLVYLGGGLGADLSTPTTLSKLYIVAELRKHEYKVNTSNTKSMSSSAAGLPASLSFDRSRLFPPFVHSSPSSSSASSPTTQPNSNGSKSREYSFGRLGSGGLQARQGSLPNHFAANSQLNTVSLPSRKLDIPKINIAPMTGKKRSTVPGIPYFRPIAAAGSNSNSSRGPLPPAARESTNPYSTLAYRFAPITSGSKAVGSPRGGPPSYTHPTTQYFLQTSSSTLNAAASAAQSSSRTLHSTAIDTMANNDKAVGKTDSNRKAEMSIRSLLC